MLRVCSRAVTLCLVAVLLPVGAMAQGPAAPPRVAAADTYSLDWACVSGGGGASTGGGFTLIGAAGQSEAGVAAGGGFSASGGFYAAGTAPYSSYYYHSMLPLIVRAWR
jgi:hypothetical protein